MEALIKAPVMLDRVFELRGRAGVERAIPGPRTVAEPGEQIENVIFSKPVEVVMQRADAQNLDSGAQSDPSEGGGPKASPDDTCSVVQAVRLAAAKEAEERAFAQAVERGLDDGRRTAAAEFATLHDLFKQLFEHASDSLPRLLADANDVIAGVVFEAVCKIVGRELVSPEGCAAAIEQVVGRTSKESFVAIKVSPTDFERLKEAASTATAADSVRRILELPIEPDSQVGLGGCILALKAGTLDGRIESQFRVFAQTLKDAIGGK